MTDTSGLTSLTPFAFYDPDGRCLRTSQGTFPWASTECSPILPRSGSMRSGELFERPMLVPRIDESGCSSLLATPTAWLGRRPSQSEGDPARWLDPERSNELSDQIAWLSEVALLPTAMAADGERSSLTHGRGNPTLLGAVSLLPSPTVGDSRNSRNSTAGRSTMPPSRPTATQDTLGDTLCDVIWRMSGKPLPTPPLSPDGNTSPDDPHPTLPPMDD